VHNETAIAIRDATHRENRGAPAPREPMRVKRTCANDARPPFVVSKMLERLVAGRDEDGDRPGVVVARQCQQRHRPEWRKYRRATLWNGPAEIARRCAASAKTHSPTGRRAVNVQSFSSIVRG